MERKNVGLGPMPGNEPEYGARQPEVTRATPELFQNPAFADIRAEMGSHWVDRQEPLARPLAGRICS
jgi:hypothetical protein